LGFHPGSAGQRHRFQLINLVGVGLSVIGLALRIAARRALGRHFSYALRTLDEHKLIKHGIYRRVRHPAYTGDLLFWSGVTLLFSSWAGFLVTLLLIPCFIYRAKIEERCLPPGWGRISGYEDHQEIRALSLLSHPGICIAPFNLPILGPHCRCMLRVASCRCCLRALYKARNGSPASSYPMHCIGDALAQRVAGTRQQPTSFQWKPGMGTCQVRRGASF
jgi:hypothetical protein